MDKILTIIIPTYNMEKYLIRCLDSLLIKSNFNLLEILIVNDGSSDSSSYIAKQYHKMYPDVFYVIDKNNGNYGSCINCGLKLAKGKYVKIIDSDDWVDTLNFELFVSYLKECDEDLILSNYSFVYNNGSKKEQSFSFVSDSKYDNSIMNSLTFKYMQMHSITYLKSILLRASYTQTESISYTDQEWIFYPMRLVNTIKYYNLDIYQYFIGRDGQTMNIDILKKNISHQIIIAERMFKEYSLFNLTFIPSPVKEYLEFRLFLISKIIYKTILLSCDDECELCKLKDFDNIIKDRNLIVYNKMNNIIINKCIPIRYIRFYRNNNNRVQVVYRRLNVFMEKILSYAQRL